MLPDSRFLGLAKTFWANVRSISERCGYTARGTKKIKVYSPADVVAGMRDLGLRTSDLYEDEHGEPTLLGSKLHEYFEYRANILNKYVEPLLMDERRARTVFEDVKSAFNPKRPVPMNKQKGEKRAPAYLTGIVNTLIEANCGELSFVDDPKKLTTFTLGGTPLRTLARRMDGCFPSAVNPIAVWEIKEYYYTTTFGSRIADGIYETLLDGMELEELREHEGIKVQHLLIVDAYQTWWNQGRSYLCRLVDMLHMGYVDEILFGYETMKRMPEIVRRWVELSSGGKSTNGSLPGQ